MRVPESPSYTAASPIAIRIPLFGDIIKKNAVSRFARTLGTLLKSGVSILMALDISKAAMANAVDLKLFSGEDRD